MASASDSPKFEKIIREICVSVGMTDWQALLQHGLLIIDGVEMKLVPEVIVHDECIVLYIDFSVVPSKGIQDFLRVLLEFNFMADTPDALIFSTNPESDQVVAMRRIPLTDEMDGEAVLKILCQEAHQASTWQHEWPRLSTAENLPDFTTALKA